jgi:hypothetical protein
VIICCRDPFVINNIVTFHITELVCSLSNQQLRLHLLEEILLIAAAVFNL